MTRDESYAEAERLYRDGFETWGREDVTARLDAKQKESIRIFQMFAESNQRLLRASQQSANALKSEQKAFDRLWQRYQSWLNRTEADLEQARGIPLFAGTLGVPKLQKLSLVRGRVELTGTNNPVQERESRKVGAVSPRNVTQNPVNHRGTYPITKQSSEPSVVQGKQWDTAYRLFRQAEDLTNQGEYAKAEPVYQQGSSVECP